jgi:hypothetical protein
VSSFPSAYANAYCHFIYSCCTPADRANPANPFSVTTQTEQNLDFDDESDCDAKLGELSQIAFQQQQASVDDKRQSYDQNDAQACLNAVSNASSACDPTAFLAATTGTGNGTALVCNTSTFFTGLVAADGTCTLDTDCAAVNSVCTPLPQDGGTPVVSSTGTCTPPPGVGAACLGVCAAGACCGGANSTCVAYVAEGATCAAGCSSTPCDPSTDYCNAGTCAVLVANGGACAPTNLGADCVSGNCVASSSTCQPQPTPKLEICTGNPDGI